MKTAEPEAGFFVKAQNIKTVIWITIEQCN